MKINYACRLLVLSVLCALLPAFPAQAETDTLKWVTIGKPGPRGNIVVTPSEVSEIAIGLRGTIYASDNVNSRVYQSLNAGATWEDISSRLVAAGATLPSSKIAIAPDATSVVAVVTDSGTRVFLSTDGGSTWHDTNVPVLVGAIQAITISRQYVEGEESLRDIAIGTAQWGDNTTTGQVWVFQVGGFVSSWRNQSLTVDGSHAGGEVSAIAFSPNYHRDNTLVVVASTAGDADTDYQNQTRLCLGKRDTSAGTTSWDYFSGYPVPIAVAGDDTDAGDDFGVSLSSSLALPSNYSSREEDSRILFVSYDRTPDASDDVYRIEDTSVYRLNANGGANIDISSIAYSGTTTSGKLLAGDVSPAANLKTVQVRRTSDPLASPPTWQTASAPPSGPGNARVNWSPAGDVAYCGTSDSSGAAEDESAFSMSLDGGGNWQQLSLIDTILTLSDIAPAPDSETLFITTYSAFGPEGVWRSALGPLGLGWYWSRQLTMDTSSDRVILRLSPDYAADYTIYAAEAGGNQIAFSHDRGNSWKRRLAPDDIVDFVVEDKNTLYAAVPGGYVRKSTSNAFVWGEPVHTGLSGINMLAMAEKGTILVGGSNGEVAYSTDGGASFTRIARAIGSGAVQVVADARYPENGIIYAATNAPDGGIWRWTIGHSASWEQIDQPITVLNTAQRIGGLATGSEGTLYALRLEEASENSGGMTRSLNPAAKYDTEIEFDFINDGLPDGATFDSALVFTNTLPYLKMSGESGQNDLWTIDIANEIIYHCQDTLATSILTLVSPKDDFQNQINQITGRALDISFRWDSPSRDVTGYELELGIYTDAAGASRILSCPVTSTGETPAAILGPYQSSPKFIEYAPGTAYYWRVRATEPLKSPWSEARSFTVAPVAALSPILLSPGNGDTGISTKPSFSWAPVAGATTYQFVLTDNAELASLMVDTLVNTAGYALTGELDYGRTYFWKIRSVEPVESAWSALANFTVREKPVAPLSPVVVVEEEPPVITLPTPSPVPEIILPPSPAPSPPLGTPTYIWAIIIIEAVLTILVIALIMRIRR